MTIKIRVFVNTGFANCTHSEILEWDMPDSSTEEEIEKAKNEAAIEYRDNYIETGWNDVD